MKSIEDLIAFRRQIHKHPELSGMESATAEKVAGQLKRIGAGDVIRDIGGHGLAAVFKGKGPGPRVLLRAELDALPIPETGSLEYRSIKDGIGHLCGHDGHMTILLGVAARLAEIPPENGEIVLLFQPAEETGQGAMQVLNDPRFATINPDVAIALHNLPSFPENHILLRSGTFACASRGVIINLRGKTSHAAHPEQGNSPAGAVAKLIHEIERLPESGQYDDFVLATVIHARIGEVAFGTTPGEATLMTTLRSASEDDMSRMVDRLTTAVASTAGKQKLAHDISFTEVFPATVNDTDMNGLVEDAAGEIGLEVEKINEPFRWSEDFGHFSSRCPAVLFGIGSGEKHPALHNPDYDFNDKLLGPAVTLMTKVGKEAGEFFIKKNKEWKKPR